MKGRDGILLIKPVCEDRLFACIGFPFPSCINCRILGKLQYPVSMNQILV